MACGQVYLYGDKSGTSLNAELIKNGLASVADDAKYDVAAYLPAKTQSGTPTTSDSTYTPSPSSSAGKDVHVRGYTRKDGTYVPPHTRSAPGTKGGSRHP